MNDYEKYIALSRYARYQDDLGRRETWEETCERVIDFWIDRVSGYEKDEDMLKYLTENVGPALKNREVMGSMRVMMTAGEALDKHNVSGYNCAYLAVDNPRAFDEILYILMCGTGVGFSCERQYVTKLPEISEEFHNSDSVIVVPDSKIGWATSFRELISLLYSGKIPKWDMSKVRPKGARLKTFGGRACLTGDTLVYKDRKKDRVYNEISIKDLFDMKNSKGKWEGVPNHFNKVKLRSFDENKGVFFKNRVIDVIDNGIAPVYLISTKNGYRIKATDNHRFLKDTGEYDFVSNFSEGDFIAVNGAKEKKTGKCVDCGCNVSNKAKRCRPCSDVSRLKADCLNTSARQRKVCRNSLKDYCERCDVKETRLVVHHKDEGPKNNSFGDPYSHKYLSFDEIVSIDYAGAERVYDLVMEGPNHNFIANGFVSHNSGPEPLEDLFKFTCETFKKAKGRRLTSIEVHDIVCKIAEVVVVGGVRRSALISLSNLSDDRMRLAKSGQWWEDNPQRALSNNSAVYNERPDIEIFLEEWLSLIKSKSGERGIFNRLASYNKVKSTGKRDPDHEWGTNPCLHPDSMVETVRGRLRIADITEPTFVYSMDEKGQLTTRPCSASWVSKKNADTLEITIASGKVVRCTPDHKIYVEGRGWIQAQDIHIGDRVIHLLRARRGACYSGVRLSSQTYRDNQMEHRLVWEAVYGKIPDGYDIHHIDGNTYNNDIDNLECISHLDHARLTALEQANNHQVLGYRDGSPGRNGSTWGFVTHPNSKGGKKEIVLMPDELKSSLHQYATVIKIEKGETVDVYDLYVEGTHNFIADFVVVHNCSEIILRSKQFCNLSEVIVRPTDTLEDLKRKVEVATVLGTLQSTLTDFRYLRKDWKKNCEEERLLGVSLTGIMDHPIMSKIGLTLWNGNKKLLEEWLEELKVIAEITNKTWADYFGVNDSTAIACVKPSGTVSQLCNTASGIHPRFSDFYIRRVRQDKKDPLAQFMIDKGFPYEDDVMNSSTYVFSFPQQSPDNSVKVNEVTAIDQLELWKIYAEYWCDHKPSITVYVKEDEWLEVGSWVYSNFDIISGVSFLPYSDHSYRQAPYEVVTKERYLELVKSMPNNVDWTELKENVDNTTSSKELACVAGYCEVI